MTESDRIRKLPAQLVDKIAAGEVIERPASVIKELIDNSIDARASSIDIEIISTDARSLRIADDGIGIMAEDIELAFSQHATSKIASAEDLETITTMGFRGEALPSIAAVADVQLVTKHYNSEVASRAWFDSSAKLRIEATAHAKGTTILINDLFGKTPARLKFLKKPEREIQVAIDTVRELAVAHPGIRFRLTSRGRKIFETKGNDDWCDTVRSLLFEKLDMSQLSYAESSKEDSGLILKVLVAPLSFARSDRRAIVTTVNGRPLCCHVLRKAISSVFSGFLPSNKYPALALDLKLPTHKIDVNVHPTKREIRYEAPQEVFRCAQRLLENSLIHMAGRGPNERFSISNQAEADFNQTILHPNNSILPTQSNGHSILQPIETGSTVAESFGLRQTDEQPCFEQINFNSKEPSDEANTKLHNVLDSPPTAPVIKSNLSVGKSAKKADFVIKNEAVTMSGTLEGPDWLIDYYLNQLSLLLKANGPVKYKYEHQQNSLISVANFPNQTKRHKIPLYTKENVWNRDGWRCVYCGKYLLHPELVKAAIRHATKGWIEKLSIENKIYKVHILREHMASCDHKLPFAHHRSLELNENNLAAVCRECNLKKRDSLDGTTWQANSHLPWLKQPVKIANIVFMGGNRDCEFSVLSE